MSAYAVGSGHHTPNLHVNSVTLNGATIQDAGSHAANFNAIANLNTGLQINPGALPLTVTSVSVTPNSGSVGTDQLVTITLQFNQNVMVNPGDLPTLTLDDGGTAFYSSAIGSSLQFIYDVGSSDRTPNLPIAGVTNGIDGYSIHNSIGYRPSFSGAIGFHTGLQVGSSPLFVTAVTTDSQTADVPTGGSVKITLHMSEGNLS